jgi:hypothetical protein
VGATLLAAEEPAALFVAAVVSGRSHAAAIILRRSRTP